MTNKRNDGNTSAKDEARTPPEIFAKLDAEFHFTCDAAATKENSLCKLLQLDSLNTDWYIGGVGSEVFWCNPPYSKTKASCIEDWVHKAYLESGKGATVVLLIPSDPSTRYFDFCFNNASEIRFMIPRVHFNHPDGTRMKGSSTTGSMIVVFRPGETPAVSKISIWKWKE